MKKSSSVYWFIVALFAAVAATLLLLSHMLTDPGKVIIQLGGDCGKNYYTFLFHSLYGNGSWFQGMNYPYGEHIIYSDGQPILSVLLSHFKGISMQQALACMNLAIALSYITGIVFTYLILLRFGVKNVLAILFACLIIVYSPQVLRIRAHFGMAYACLLPILFYCNIRYHAKAQYKWLVIVLITGLIMSFLHLYMGALVFIWVAFYTLGYLLFIKRPLKERINHIAPVLIMAVILFVVIKLVVLLTDPIKDRPSFPLNNLDNITHIKDIISSPYSPFWTYLRDKKGIHLQPEGTEGYTYPGLTVFFAVFLSFALGLYHLIIKKDNKRLLVGEGSFSVIWLFIAFGALLLAMGAPFIWHMKWALNYLSVFKQFRAMARFSWIFYYIITIYGAIAIHQAFTSLVARRKLVLAYALAIGSIGIWAYEASSMIRFTRDYIANGLNVCNEFYYKNEQNWPSFLAEHKYKGSDFQGIILFPFFMSGSEKLWVGNDPSWPLSIGMRPALMFNLPIVDVMMSRTSWSLTEKQVKLVGGPYADRPMLRDLKSNKPFLLIQYDGEYLTPDHEYLLKSSDSIGHQYNAFIYAFYPERMRAHDKRVKDSILALAATVKAADTIINEQSPCYIAHFDTAKATDRFFGTGACTEYKQEEVVIATIPLGKLTDNEPYEFSCWFLLDDKDYRSPHYTLESLDSAGNVIDYRDALTKQSLDNKGMWFRSSVFFVAKINCTAVRCILHNSPMPTYKIMDELQLRHVDATIITKDTEGRIMVNNHLVKDK
jgi:hypothetical protein